MLQREASLTRTKVKTGASWAAACAAAAREFETAREVSTDVMFCSPLRLPSRKPRFETVVPWSICPKRGKPLVKSVISTAGRSRRVFYGSRPAERPSGSTALSKAPVEAPVAASVEPPIEAPIEAPVKLGGLGACTLASRTRIEFLPALFDDVLQGRVGGLEVGHGIRVCLGVRVFDAEQGCHAETDAEELEAIQKG